MAPKMKLPVLVMLLLATAAGLALATRDPELKQCKHQCGVQRQFDEKQKQDCERSCEDYYKMKKERERGGRDFDREEKHERQEEEEEEEYGQRGEQDPYVFEDEHFETTVDTEEGRVWTLPKFTERSKLLRGIENFRISILEANPSTFIIPSHFDAEMIFFVAQGRATITTIREKRASFDLKRGDVFRVPSGTPFYMINKEEREKLKIVELLQPTSLPGDFEVFHGLGGENPESFYTAFSWELLEASLKIPSDKLKKFFKQQKEGSIMKASREQIRSLSQHEEVIPRIWPFSEGEAGRPFNLFKQHPSQSNKFGRLFEAFPHEFSELRDLGIAIAFANLTKGSMVAPHYNSKAMKIAVVLEGEGKLQMACPHVSSSGTSAWRRHGGGKWSERERGEPTYQKIRGNLRRGTVFIVPTGHPFSVFASPNHSLQIVCFEVNAHGNMKYLLAGKDNIVNKMESVARELGFNSPGREVEKMFKQQEEEFFFPGPSRQAERDWAEA